MTPTDITKGDIIVLKNIVSREYFGARLDRETQLRWVRRVLERELTPCQRRVVEGIYVQKLSQSERARRLGVHRSTVSRTLTRAKERLRRCLQY